MARGTLRTAEQWGYGGRRKSHIEFCVVCDDPVYSEKVVYHGEGVQVTPGTNEKRPVTEAKMCPKCAWQVLQDDWKLKRLLLGAIAVQKLVDAGFPQADIDAEARKWGLERSLYS